jgi:hypothetical protein
VVKVCERCEKEFEAICIDCRFCSKNCSALNWHYNNRDRSNSIRKSYRDKIREKILEAYGNKCTCCGEENKEFLQIDHINGGGNKERKVLKNAFTLYRSIIKRKFPAEYRLLCANCNSSLGHYGYCPHQKKGNNE